MLRVILRKELLEQLVTLRFAIGFALAVSLFAVGALAWNARYAEQTARFAAGQQEYDAARQRQASDGLFYVSHGSDLWCPPSPAGLLSGGYSQGLPNVAHTSSFQVSGLEPRADRNPWLFRRDLDWSFTIGLLGTLLALLLTHDAVAGEKERGTLRQALANQVPRVTLLWGKYLATMASLAGPILVGATVALLIVGMGSAAGIPREAAWAVPGVLVGGFLCVSVFVWLGLLISSRTSSSSLALLVLLMLWALLAVFVPSGGGLIGDQFVKVARATDVVAEVSNALRDAPDGADKDAARRAIREAQWRGLVRQVEVAHTGTQVSPVAAHTYLTEVLCGTGVSRFRTFLAQADEHRRRLYDYVKEADATDPESNHKVIHGHWNTISHRSVRPEDIPRFTFREVSLQERLKEGVTGILVLLLYNLIFAAAAFWSFARYDVR